ncbi:C protein [bank vole virus 1]|uniref:C protein n=1 Tax=bank vole virus 1 TaxID=2756244 RepID=A0A2H4PJ60_9MONO|nr:C protein [bank vole virus 1]ATW63186.1 C protein [bank vole virus 1]
MPSKLWKSLKKLRVPRPRNNSVPESTSPTPTSHDQTTDPEVRVRIGVRRNPDLVGVERQTKVLKQDLALVILTQLRDLEKDYPAQVPHIITSLKYSTLQFVKTILMRVMEGLPINSTWVRQVEEYICTTSQEVQNLKEAVEWVRKMMEDQDRT